MDAADRAELERLRRRVFGPEGDDSPAVLKRLAVLEAELHAEPRALSPSAEPEPDPPREPSPPPSPPHARPERPDAPTPLRTVVTLAAVVVVLFLGFRLMAELPSPDPVVRTETVTARDAYTLARDTDGIVIERLPLRPPAVDPDPDAEPPWFPTSGTVAEATHIATLYGWEVWIAEADGIIQREACLSVRREVLVRGRCVPAVLRGTNALAVTLPYDAFPAKLRPAGMEADQRVGFWWVSDASVYVVLADEAPPPLR